MTQDISLCSNRLRSVRLWQLTAAHLSSDEEMSVDAAHERAGHLISDLLICKLKGCVLEPKLLRKVRWEFAKTQRESGQNRKVVR